MNIELKTIKMNICLEELEQEIKELEGKIEIYEDMMQDIKDKLDKIKTLDLDRHIRIIKKDIYEIQQLNK